MKRIMLLIILASCLLLLSCSARAQDVSISQTVCIGSQCGICYPPDIPTGDFGVGALPGSHIGATVSGEATYSPPSVNVVPKPSEPKTDADGQNAAGGLNGGLSRPDPTAAQGHGRPSAEARGATAGSSVPTVTTEPNSTYRPGTTAGDRQVASTAGVGGSDPVNPFNGEMLLRETDLRLPGVGLDFELTRTYRSRSRAAGPIGYGWDHNYNEHLSMRSLSEYLHFDGTGRRTTFTYSDHFAADDGFCAVLRAPTDESTDQLEVCQPSNAGNAPQRRVRLVALDGTVRTFDAPRDAPRRDSVLPLQSIADPNGNVIQVVNDQGRVSRVIDTVGRSIEFLYDARGYLYTVAVDNSPESVQYEVDADGDLVKAVPAASAHSGGFTYTYDKTPREDAPYPTYFEILQSRAASEAGCARECEQAQDEAAFACETSCEDQRQNCTRNNAGSCAQSCDTDVCRSQCTAALKATCTEAVNRSWEDARRAARGWCGTRCTDTCEKSCQWKDWYFYLPWCRISIPVCTAFGGTKGGLVSCTYHECGRGFGATIVIDADGRMGPPQALDPSPGVNTGDCVACCLNGDFCNHGAERNCRDDCMASFSSTPPARFVPQCINAYPQAEQQCADAYCKPCVHTCTRALDDECGTSAGVCNAACSATDWQGICTTTCMQGVEARMQDPKGVRYGHETALMHNLLEIRRLSDGALKIRNAYGEDPNSPSFDAVIRQDFGEGGVVSAHYYALDNGALPAAGSEDDGAVTPESAFGYLDVCTRQGTAARSGSPANGYNRASAATVVVDRKGRKSTMYFNAAGLLLRTSMFGGSLTYDTDYYPHGPVRSQAKSTRDGLASWSCAQYDKDDALTSVVQGGDPKGARGSEYNIYRMFEWRSNPKRLTRVIAAGSPSYTLVTHEWDDKGNLIRSTTPGLEQLSYVNDVRGRPVSITDRTGAVTAMTYDQATGLLQETTRDASGPQPERVIYMYDSAGYLTTVNQVGYEQTSIGYEAGWPAYTYTWFRDRPEFAAYHGTQFSSSLVDVDGQILNSYSGFQLAAYTYDTEGLVRTVTVAERAPKGDDPGGQKKTVCIHRNLAGEEDVRVLPEGNEIRTTREFDANGNETVTVSRGPHVRSSSSPNAWDGPCNEWKGANVQAVVEIDVFDAEGQLVKRTDATGQATSFGYDAWGRLSRSKNPRGVSTSWGFDPLGNRAWDSTFSGNASPLAAGGGADPAVTGIFALTQYQHDIAGRTTSTARLHALPTASGKLSLVGDGYAKSTTAYAKIGSTERKAVRTDDGGHQTTLTYDALGRLAEVLLPTAQRVVHEYPSELIEVIQSPASDGAPVKRTIVRDGRGLPLREEDGDTKVLWSAEYDARGLRTALTLESGGKWSYAWDGFGRLLSKTGYDAAGTVLSTESREYDLNDNLRAVVDGRGNRTTYQYDALDRRVQETLADGSSYSVGAFLGGSALPLADSTPTTQRTYSYYADGALMSLKVTDGAQTVDQFFSRDLLGRPIEARQETRDSSGLLTSGSVTDVQLSWDTLGNRVYERRTVDESAPAGGVSRLINGDGLVERIDLDRTAIAHAFDPLHRLQIAQVVSGYAASLGYRGLGAESTVIQSADGRPLSQTETTRDGREQIHRIMHKFKDGVHDQVEEPSYHAGWPFGFGRVDLSSQRIDTFTAASDDIGRLVAERHLWNGSSENSASYGLDKANNWATMNASRGIGSQQTLSATPTLTATNAVTGGYPDAAHIVSDAEGRVTSVDSNRTFTYDPLGRLIQVTSSAGTFNFIYDAFGRLSREVGSGVQYDFTPDGDQVIAETRNADASTTAYFVHSDKLDQPLFREQGGKIAFYHWGSDGSLSFVSDENGALVEKYSYSAYGERSVEDANGNPIPNSLIGNRYGYRGQMYHAPTGLYSMRARWYVPQWGRFLTPDPIGLEGGQNRYMYVNASPTLFWDPFGLDPNAAADGGADGDGLLGALMPMHLVGARRGGNSLADQLDMSRATRVNQFTRQMAGATVMGSAGTFGAPLMAAGGAPLAVAAAKTAWVVGGGPVLVRLLQDARTSGLWDSLRLNAPELTEQIVVPAYEAATMAIPGSVGSSAYVVVGGTKTPIVRALSELPHVAPGTERVFRGTYAPGLTQVGSSYRGNPSAAPSGAERFLSEADARLHAGPGGPYGEGVSVSRKYGAANGYGTHTIVYDVPEAVFSRLPSGDPALFEYIFEGSIPDSFRVGVISR
jgi:RHS repeat-associated protein